MINRSIERDYDINYHSRAAHKCMNELVKHITQIEDVKHDPYALILSLDEQWSQLKEKLSATWY